MPELTVTRPDEMPGVLRLTFNDPATLNSLTTDVLRAVVRSLREARYDDTVQAVLFTGEGERAFSSGISLDALGKLETDEDRALFYTLGLELRESVYALEKPVIAAVRGACAGGGFEIALCCDLIYAQEGSKFVLPEVNIALTPGMGGAITLAAKLPMNRAMEMIWFGERVTAEELHRWGLVNAVFPPETFWDETARRVNKLLAKPQFAVRALKRVLSHTAVSGDQSESLRHERMLAVDEMRTTDFREGVAAFREKRTPEFNRKPE
ncbi:MAG: enoyl-CoA hydratase/isomerase family protein [Oscillospiraceae bacterium]|jgi:enoyl-CoA hydratase/carnithine racemase|nr:enoyl-CoA hydratase/isomerase family protein [Oscillospiraceae bacterium]